MTRSDGSVAASRIDTVKPAPIPGRQPEPPAPVQKFVPAGMVRGAMPAKSNPADRKIGGNAVKSLSPGVTTAQEAEQRMGGQDAGAALALVAVAVALAFAFAV